MSVLAPETNLMAGAQRGDVEIASTSKQLDEVRLEQRSKNTAATASDIKEPGGLPSTGYFDLMRHSHFWDNFPSRNPNGFGQNAVFLAQKYAVAPVAEAAFFGGLPGAGTGAGVGLGLLGAEAAICKMAPSVKPLLAGRPGALVPGAIGRCAEAGLLIGAADYGVSMLADKTFGVDSSIAKILQPNFVGIALATAGVLLTRNPKAMACAGLAGYTAGKVYNYFDLPSDKSSKV